MYTKLFPRLLKYLPFLLLLCIFSASIVSATETESPPSGQEGPVSEETAAPEETPKEETSSPEEERPEPDAYFEPIQTNEIEGWPQGPAVWAESAVVMDLDSGAILYEKNMGATKYPASITKILTTLVAIENSRLDERVTFSENAIFGIERDSSHIGIRVGEILSMEECLYGMMLESANEVCLAVAEHISGSVDAFVELMNQKAAELGCTNTHFTNPNGLPDENHYTTAHDMALIAQAAYANPTFRKVCQTNTYCIPTTNVCGELRWLSNHHKMLPERDYFYEGCTGGKTGFTQAALNTLVTYAERDGRKLVCVSLRTNGPQVYVDTAALLDYGFQNFQNITIHSRSSCADTKFLYPSIYFGEPCTVDNLRLSCSATIPAGATAEQIQTVPALADGAITRTYLYNQYQIGQESIPDTAIRKLLTPVSEHSAKANASESDITEKINLPNMEKATSLFKKIPIYIYLLVLLLIVVVIMEIILLRKKQKRKKREKHR